MMANAPAMIRPTGQGWTGVGWTGSRRITDDAKRHVDAALEKLHSAVWIITGGCVGTDAYVAKKAHALGLHVHTILPADRSRVDPHWREHCTTYEEMPPGTTYPDRNARIVVLATCDLFAVPEFPEHAGKSLRSGTWQTVRLARQAWKQVHVHIQFPNGGNRR
jgi:predicted Rossmann fold nucleotide-binding protein DprA/Smf involved in DNA uptake